MLRRTRQSLADFPLRRGLELFEVGHVPVLARCEGETLPPEDVQRCSETPLHSIVVALIVETPYSNYEPCFINMNRDCCQPLLPDLEVPCRPVGKYMPARFATHTEAQRAADTHEPDGYPNAKEVSDGLLWQPDPEFDWCSIPHCVEERANWQCASGLLP